MAVREFDGVDDRITLGSTGVAVANGGFTIYALVKPASLTSGEAYVSMRAGGSGVGSMDDAGIAKLALDTDSLSVQPGLGPGLTAGDWQHIRITKPAGTSAVKFSRAQLGTASWSHSTSSGTHPDIAGIVDAVVVGGFSPASALGAKDMRCAVVALLPELSDTDVEAIDTLKTSQYLADLGAYGLWNFNQASTGTTVLDVSGGSAHQTGIVGTVVVTGDDPAGWDYSVTVIPPLSFSYRLSGGSSNSNPLTSIGGAVSSVHAGITLFDDVSNAERTSGLVDYRLVYVYNDDAADGIVSAYISTQLETGREIALGAPTQAAGVTVTAVANDQTAPAGVSFSAPTTAGSGVSLGTVPAGSFRGLWLRRTVNAGTAADPTNFPTVMIDVSRTS